jgi:hypothetical protein
MKKRVYIIRGEGFSLKDMYKKPKIIYFKINENDGSFRQVSKKLATRFVLHSDGISNFIEVKKFNDWIYKIANSSKYYIKQLALDLELSPAYYSGNLAFLYALSSDSLREQILKLNANKIYWYNIYQYSFYE